jgi:type IV secretory pathway VirB2 component (pilin)
MTKIFINTSKKLFTLVGIALFLFGLGFSVNTFAVDEPAPDTSTTTTSPKSGDKACEGISKDNNLCYLQPSNIDCLFQRAKGQPQCQNPLFEQVLNFLQQLAPYVATLIIVLGGYEYFSDKNFKETSSTATIQAGVFGLIIVLLAPAITSVITGSFTAKGIDPKELNILLTQLVDFLINISTFVAVVVIVIGGYTYFTEGFSGDGKSTKALNLVSGGVLGLIVMLFARPVASLIRDTLKVTYRKEDFKSTYVSGNNSGFVSRIEYVEAPFVSVIKSLLSDFLIPLSSVATVLFLVFGGWYMLTSSGDQKKYETGLNFVRNAVIGFIVVLLATTIVQLLFFFVKPTEFISGGSNCALVANADKPECKANAAGTLISPTGTPTKDVPTNPGGAEIFPPKS